MKNIRVLIVDDHAVVRQGLAAILSPRNGFEVIGEAANGREAIRLERELTPDVIVMDLVMPEMDGLEATKAIKTQNPEARILVLTSFDEEDRIAAIMAAGASGYLMKDSSSESLMQAIRSNHSGHLIMSDKVLQAISGSVNKGTFESLEPSDLTPREREVLQGVVDGLTNQAIAVQLGISQTTVRSHVSSILAKLQVTNRTQAALIAQKRNLL